MWHLSFLCVRERLLGVLTNSYSCHCSTMYNGEKNNEKFRRCRNNFKCDGNMLCARVCVYLPISSHQFSLFVLYELAYVKLAHVSQVLLGYTETERIDWEFRNMYIYLTGKHCVSTVSEVNLEQYRTKQYKPHIYFCLMRREWKDGRNERRIGFALGCST